MVTLRDAIPLDHFNSLFSVVEEIVSASDREEFYETAPSEAATVNLFAWDEAVARGVVKNGAEMKKYHPRHLSKAYELTKSRIKEEPFKEVFCATYFNELSSQNYVGQMNRFPFATIDLVVCYPGDIHISDVELLDLDKPTFQASGVTHRRHKGLHVFSCLLDGLLAVAKKKGLQRISLVAASPAAHEVFTRYGFRPTTTPVSQHAFRTLGYSHAMALDVS